MSMLARRVRKLSQLREWVISTAPEASATAARFHLGASALVGGNAQGTWFGVNTAGGYTGDIAHWQVGGASRFRFDYLGQATFPAAPQATANRGLVSLGSGPFDGSTAGFFTGSANGTVLAINAASGFAGNLFDFQLAGAARASLSAAGLLTVLSGRINSTYTSTVDCGLRVNSNIPGYVWTTTSGAADARHFAAVNNFSGAGQLDFLAGASQGANPSVYLLRLDGVNAAVGIGGATHASALLMLNSTSKGFLPPVMTTTQRDLIATPATGLVVYNSTTNKLNVFTGAAWEAVTSA